MAVMHAPQQSPPMLPSTCIMVSPTATYVSIRINMSACTHILAPIYTHVCMHAYMYIYMYHMCISLVLQRADVGHGSFPTGAAGAALGSCVASTCWFRRGFPSTYPYCSGSFQARVSACLAGSIFYQQCADMYCSMSPLESCS